MLLATSKSAEKRARQAEKRRRRNRAAKSAVRTHLRGARRLIEQGDVEMAEEAVVVALRAMDTAASKGVLHKNNVARRKSRLMKALNATRKSQAPAA